MVEIGAGGGSIASVDSLSRVTVGPESAGAEPGPACYGRGGTRAHRDRRRRGARPHRSRLLRRRLDQALAGQGRQRRSTRPVGTPLGLARARRGLRHQRDRRGEHGQRRARARRRARQGAAGPHPDRLRRRGAHACRAARGEARHPPRPGAERRGRGLGGRLPDGAGRLRGRAQPLRPARSATSTRPTSTRCSPRCAPRPRPWSRRARPRRKLVETRTADMRYRGQGHEITVDLPTGAFTRGVARQARCSSTRPAMPRPSDGPSRASTSRS